MKKLFVTALVALSGLMAYADPEQCLIEGNCEQAAEHIQNSRFLLINAYWLDTPQYLLVDVKSAVAQPCQDQWSSGTHQIFVDGEIIATFPTDKNDCVWKTKASNGKGQRFTDVLILNYAFTPNAGAFVEIYDMFNGNPYSSCLRMPLPDPASSGITHKGYADWYKKNKN
jgi:hypothetical protein